MAKLFSSDPGQQQIYTEEGLLRSKYAGGPGGADNTLDEIIFAFKGPEEKRRLISEKADDLIAWLEKIHKEDPKLSLDIPWFIRTLRTAKHGEPWRFYYVLDDDSYHQILRDIANNKKTHIETYVSYKLMAEYKSSKMMKDVKTVKDLIETVKQYKDRTNNIVEKLYRRPLEVEGLPYQTLLGGMVDLTTAVNKIVRNADIRDSL